MMNNTGEDNHQEAFDQTEGVGEPCQTDGASKGLGKYYHLDLFHQNITTSLCCPCSLTLTLSIMLV